MLRQIKHHKKIIIISFIMACIIVFITQFDLTRETNTTIYTTELSIENHQFTPHNLVVPANTRVKLKIYNKDNEPEEFESVDLKREKIIPAHSFIHVNLGPLKPGKYEFFGDFHQDTANGYLIVK